MKKFKDFLKRISKTDIFISIVILLFTIQTICICVISIKVSTISNNFDSIIWHSSSNRVSRNRRNSTNDSRLRIDWSVSAGIEWNIQVENAFNDYFRVE